MPTDPQKIQATFVKIVALPTDQRQSALDAECGENFEMRQRIEVLLIAHDEPDHFLDRTDGGFEMTSAHEISRANSASADLQAGKVISDRYVLREKIGEGGMGEVWVAKQTEPVKRRVALKFIKTGMDSKTVLARFEQERQALALMDHPNIAGVLDAGMTDGNQPFFVMELVHGLPLDQFCDEARLSLRERLELLIPICQAVQHAHQKGIVHRDLKPANVLVTMIDGKPIPKVIDFGVSKAIGGRLSEETLTQFGAVLGTLEYMSPEQAGFSGDDVDTRGDIYSLGVMMYEMLTGLRPIDKQRLQEAALSEVVRIICEEEPAKPSLRLSTDGGLPSAAAIRRTEPKKLMAMLSGELDWVVMKCLEKDRARRYDTVSGLVQDIERYLVDEPVKARPPSTGYRLQKFIKRHKGVVVAVGICMLTLTVGVTSTTLWLFKALDAQREAENRLLQRKKSNEILLSVFANLNPRGAFAYSAPLNARLAKNLEQAAVELEGDEIDEPLVVAKMQDLLGTALVDLGRGTLGITLLQKAVATYTMELGPEHDDTLRSKSNLATAYRMAGEIDLAVSLHEKTFEVFVRKFGVEHATTLAAMNNLAVACVSAGDFERAMSLYQELLEVQKRTLGPRHLVTLSTLHNLACEYRRNHDLDQALLLEVEVVERCNEVLGPSHPNTILAISTLAFIYAEAGDFNQATGLAREATQRATEEFGTEHPLTLSCNAILGKVYQLAGDLDHALPLLKKSYELRVQSLGLVHLDTLTSMSSLGEAYSVKGDGDQALPLLKKSFELLEQTLGPEHPDTLNSMSKLALCYLRRDSLDLALPLYKKALERKAKVFGLEHRDTLNTMHNIATTYYMQRNYTAANDTTVEALEIVSGLPDLSASQQDLLRSHASNLLALKKYSEAEPVIRKWLEVDESMTDKTWLVHYMRFLLGHSLCGQQKYDLAAPFLQDDFSEMASQRKKIPRLMVRRVNESITDLMRLYRDHGMPEEAAKWGRRIPVNKPKSKPKSQMQNTPALEKGRE